MTVKERLKKYIDYKNISISAFCRSIGVSNAYVSSMNKSIQPDKLKSITLNYPDLNTEWLLTGEGEMLKKMPSDYEQTHKTGMAEEQYHCLECIKKQKIIDELIEKCELQKKLIYEYELQLEKRRKVDCG